MAAVFRGHEFLVDIPGFFAQVGDLFDHVRQELVPGVGEGLGNIFLIQPLAHQAGFQPHIGHGLDLGAHPRGHHQHPQKDARHP